jgi:cytochrome c
MMRRRLLLVSMPLALAACSGGQEDAATADTPTAAAEAVAEDPGKLVFNQCVACHTIDKGGRNGLGPNLHGIVGRKVASVEGFAYSPAMKAKGGVWDEAALDVYIADPRAAVVGNKMVFVGINDAEKRKALIGYLSSLK